VASEAAARRPAAPAARHGRAAVAFHVRDAGPAPGLLEAFEPLRGGACPWLLDSARADARLGRFSFAGAEPWAVLRARGREVELRVRRAVHPDWPVGRHRLGDDPFAALRRVVPAAASGDGGPTDAIPFVGGAVGYLGYELVEGLEPVRLGAREGAPFADATFLLVDALLAYDHGAGRLWRCGLGFGADAPAARAAAEARVAELARAAVAAPPAAPPPVPRRRARARARHDAASYGALVDVVKEAITRGDVYQACLTHRIEADFDGDPWGLYRRLRRTNPAPFAAYLALPEGAILSSSPERFLRVDGEGRVEARPIKGTRECGPSPAAAAASRRALATSAKDRAENVMIVDLYRNDLGRVCETGSVRVPELFAIERHGGLHQMVSTVTGRLAAGRDRLDLVRASFPPGSMTGAPKIAAMRLLAGLEPVRRGAYSGALGYLDARGGMDLSVVIRTLLVAEGRTHVHVGGGIVADSQPHAEWCETLGKARALLDALGVEDGAAAPVRPPAPGAAPTPEP
jgi:aminodeoxychorismate synthase component I